MPYLSIETNLELEEDAASLLVESASKLLATELGKPEEYVMVSLRPVTALLFAGASEPAVFLEVKSIGLPGGGNGPLAGALTDLVVNQCRVKRSRVYVTFTDVKPSHWAHEGECFG